MNFKHNPFTWDMSSGNISSGVIDFNVKTNHGAKLDISGLQSPVELYIPRKPDSSNSSMKRDERYFVKPGQIQYHRIWFSKGEVAHVEIKPQHGTFLDIYVSHEVKPTQNSHDYRTTVPDFSSCLSTSDDSELLSCTSDPYTISLSSLVTGHTGRHFLGVSFKPSAVQGAEEGLDALELRSKRDCGSHGGRQKRSCVGVKDPPTTQAPTPRIHIPQYNSSTDANYTMYVGLAGCMYWSEAEEQWTTEGCQVWIR